MSKLVIFETTLVNIAIAVVVVSVAAINSVYAQNTTTTTTTTTQQTNHSNINSATSQLKAPNTNAIVDAINAKIRSIYEDNDEKATNSATKIDHVRDK